VYSPRRSQLQRLRPQTRFRCEVLTAGISNRRQLSLLPNPGVARSEDLEMMMQLPAPVNGVDPIPTLRSIAQQTVAEIPSSNTMARARALERYLSDAPRFTYTLALPKREPGVDPLEDFVTLHPQGHCEFFAGSLALMLRSVGIPSRIIVGFKGGEIDAITS